MTDILGEIPGIDQADWERLCEVCVAPDDIVQLYHQTFGEEYDGQPIAIPDLLIPSQEATIRPTTQDMEDSDTLGLALTTTIGSREMTFSYNMYLTPAALYRAARKQSSTAEISYWDVIDHQGAALNRISWSLGAVATAERNTTDTSPSPQGLLRKLARRLASSQEKV